MMYWSEKISRNCIYLLPKQKVNTYSEELFSSTGCVSNRSWPPVKFMTSRETQEFEQLGVTASLIQ